jgi:ribose transport system permease protein
MTMPDQAGAPARVPARPPVRGRRQVTAAAGVVVRTTAQYIGVLSVLVITVGVLWGTQPAFMTAENFVNIAELNAELMLVAIGLTFVLLTGGIDLSVGATWSFTGIVLWKLVVHLPQPVALVLAIVCAGAIGMLVNGLLIGRAGMSFLVVTIGSASLLHGLGQVWSGGQTQSIFQYKFLTALGGNRAGGIPLTVWITAGAFVLAVLLLRYTGFGRMIYAVGGNPEAARLAGINVGAVRIAVYTICALLAGLAGVLSAAHIGAASPDAGIGMELTAAAAVLLGGTSFLGGRGSLLGTLLGIAFLGVLQNGVTLSGVSPYWSNVVSGIVLIAAIGIDRLRNGRPMG